MSELDTAPVPGRGATNVPRNAEAITTKERSQFQLVMLRFLRHRLAVGSLVIFLLVVAFAFLGPMLWQYDHTINREIPSEIGPNWSHPFGTTRAGNDVMGQVMRGTQQSLKVAFLVAALATSIGAVWGAVAGFYRGWVDALMMRFVDVILVVPLLAVVLALAGSIRGGTTWLHVALILGFVQWLGVSRLVRGMVLSLREQEFIEASRAMGASDLRIILRHLIPNTTGIIIVAATLEIAVAVLTEAALSFLGLGIQPPDTSLGLLIEDARTSVFTAPWLFYIPGGFLILIALTINFVGDGFRDALDPRQTMVRR
jgi:peptide/nickel transport system permease protein